MPETSSSMVPLGTAVPHLRLVDAVSGRTVDAAAELQGKKGLVVAFISNHSPFVRRIREQMGRIANRAIDLGLAVIAINSNDEKEYPEDGPKAMQRVARIEGWRFPFVFDATQESAKAFRATCTPDFFVFDGRGILVYRGQFDDSRPNNDRPITGEDLAAAIAAVAAGRAPSLDQKPSVGSDIKWKPGSEPSQIPEAEPLLAAGTDQTPSASQATRTTAEELAPTLSVEAPSALEPAPRPNPNSMNWVAGDKPPAPHEAETLAASSSIW
jgi:hypothetical protein